MVPQPGRSIPLLIDVGTTITDAGGGIQYLLVLLFAAFPWVEILVVIPIAIGVGLHPVTTGVVAFIGNAGSVLLLLVFHRRIARWRAGRHAGSTTESGALAGDAASIDEAATATDAPPTGDTSSTRRRKWADRIWNRYGLPGLSLAAPILTGVHLAALIALAAGSRRRDIGMWMTVGIALWTIGLVAGTAFGISIHG